MKPCFGTIYPDLSEFRFNKEISGKVFKMRIDTRGAGHREKYLEHDLKAWQECQECEFYQSCYDFSNAKMVMQRVMA